MWERLPLPYFFNFGTSVRFSGHYALIVVGNFSDSLILKGMFIMKFCSKCGNQCDDTAIACPMCNTPFPTATPVQPVDTRDHTAEFDVRDVSTNKVVAMLTYLIPIVGLIIAILLAGKSKYIHFHVRTALKFTVVECLLTFMNVVPLLGQLAFGLGMGICTVLRIISFVSVCKGQSKDPAIIGKLGFLK